MATSEHRRSYRQHCGIARALDVVGERWTLLLVRDLLIGPKRFKDLLDGLPGIGTNLLAARLKQLEEDGLVRHTMLPPPAGVKVYELTELGRKLEPALTALGQWGGELLGTPCPGDYVDLNWLILDLKSKFRPEQAIGLHESYELRVAGHVFHLEVSDGVFEIAEGSARRPAATLIVDAPTFQALETGRLSLDQALAGGAARVEGDPAALARCAALFAPRVPRGADG